MSIASDRKIIELIASKKLEVFPFVYSNIQPSSIDLTLDNRIMIPKPNSTFSFREPVSDDDYDLEIFESYSLPAGKMILTQIKEKIKIPGNYCGTISNRSSIARIGLDVAIAGYINPGYEGQLAIVIQNIGDSTIEIVPGVRICQIVLHEVDPKPMRDYSQRKDVKYFGEKDNLISKLHLDEELVACREKIHAKGDIDNTAFAKELDIHWNKLAAKNHSEFISTLDKEARVKLGLEKEDA